MVTGDGKEGRRAKRLAGREIEAGVVQRAAERAVRDDAACERRRVVGARRAHGEEAGPALNEDDRLSARVSEERNALPEFLARNAFVEVRPLQFTRVVCQGEKYYRPGARPSRNSFATSDGRRCFPTTRLLSLRMAAVVSVPESSSSAAWARGSRAKRASRTTKAAS